MMSYFAHFLPPAKFELLTQMYEHLNGDYNPFGKYLVKETKLKKYSSRYRIQGAIPVSDDVLVEMVAKFIHNTVSFEIKQKEVQSIRKIGCYSLIAEIFSDENFGVKDIFSLNHDTLIESLLVENNISYTDGFCVAENGFNKWNSQEFENSDRKIRLLKLHGSIDWKDAIDLSDNRSFLIKDHARTQETLIDSNFKINNREVILLGTRNKILASPHWLDRKRGFYRWNLGV